VNGKEQIARNWTSDRCSIPSSSFNCGTEALLPQSKRSCFTIIRKQW